MSGEVIELFPRCRFKFSNLAVGQTLEVPMIRSLDVDEFADLSLIVRVHAADIAAGDSTVQVLVRSVSTTCEDPSVDFVDADPVATVTLDSGAAAGDLEVDPLSPTFGGSVQVRVMGSRPTSGNVDVTLSAELVAHTNARPVPKVTGDFSASGSVLVAGAEKADAPSDADDVVVGDGSGSPGMFLYGASGSNFATYAMGRVAGTSRGWMRYIFNSNTVGFGVSNTEELILTSAQLRPNADAGLDLGASNKWWAVAYMNQVLVAGASAPVSSDADDIVIGDATGNVGLSLRPSNSGHGGLYVDDNGAIGGRFRYSNNSNKWFWAVSGADRVSLSTSALESAVDGATALGTTSLRWSELWLTTFADFAEQSSQADPAAGAGRYWVKDDAPNSAMFTDDAGNDHPLSLMPTLHFAVGAADLPASGAPSRTTVSGSDNAVLEYAASGTDTAYWETTLPRQYSGNGLTVRVWLAPSTGTVKATGIVFDAAFERHNSGYGIGSSSFATDISVNGNVPGTANELMSLDLAFTNSELDSLAAGEPGRVRVRRLGDDGNDTYTGLCRVVHVQVIENP